MGNRFQRFYQETASIQPVSRGLIERTIFVDHPRSLVPLGLSLGLPLWPGFQGLKLFFGLLAVVIDSYATHGTCLEYPGFEGLYF